MSKILNNPANHFSSDPNIRLTLSMLQRCSNMEELKQIHSQMFKTGLIQHSISVTKLLDSCMSTKHSNNNNNLVYAKTVFDRIDKPNTFMWNIMIRGYANSNLPEQALLMYDQMLYHRIPHNSYTFPFLLKSFCSLSSSPLEETRQIHAHVIKFGFGSEVYAVNSLVHVYAVSGTIDSAITLFDRVPQRDTISWNSMIDGYAKCGSIDKALEVFKNMPIKNVVSWTTMMSCYVRAGMSNEALTLFHDMQESGVRPDKVTLAAALSACSQLGSLEQGKWIHAYVNKTSIEIDRVLSCVLMDMYGKCGDMREAVEVFGQLKTKCVTAWTTMISGYAVNGNGVEALNLFTRMQKTGIEPNPVTFTAVLTACSHAGLVDEGRILFESIEKKHSMKPRIEHYGCMVELLSRAGLLEEAKEFIEKMDIEPNAVVYGALLKGCRIHRDRELGKRIGEVLIEKDPNHGGRYIHLASIHAMAREWDHAVDIRRMMKERQVVKLPGRSVISLNGVVHEFFAGDRSHPEMGKIDCLWNKLSRRLRQNGYEPVLEDLPLDLSDGEKEVALHQHSEKLAITLGLIETKPGVTLRIVKNLRVCEDCHNVAKLISKMYGRDIVMRDRRRFHFFRDGSCNCGDFW